MSLREEIKDSLSYFGATEQEKADEIINKILDAAIAQVKVATNLEEAVARLENIKALEKAG